MNDATFTIGLRAHRALLPQTFLPLDKIRAESDTRALAEQGFDGAWISDNIAGPGDAIATENE